MDVEAIIAGTMCFNFGSNPGIIIGFILSGKMEKSLFSGGYGAYITFPIGLVICSPEQYLNTIIIYCCYHCCSIWNILSPLVIAKMLPQEKYSVLQNNLEIFNIESGSRLNI